MIGMMGFEVCSWKGWWLVWVDTLSYLGRGTDCRLSAFSQRAYPARFACSPPLASRRGGYRFPWAMVKKNFQKL